MRILNLTAQAKEALEVSKSELDRITELLYQELDRLDEEKTADFTVAIKAFLNEFLETQKQVRCARFFGLNLDRRLLCGSLISNIRKSRFFADFVYVVVSSGVLRVILGEMSAR